MGEEGVLLASYWHKKKNIYLFYNISEIVQYSLLICPTSPSKDAQILQVNHQIIDYSHLNS